MSSNLIGLIELLFVFGVVLWFGFSQLRALKRHDDEQKKDKARPPPCGVERESKDD